MTPDATLHLEVRPTDTDIVGEWTDATGDVHVYDHGFDSYGTEVIHLDAPYDARDDIKALPWEATHRQWTGSEWRLDFAALDHAVRHLLERDYSVTIPAPDVQLYVADFDAPFLETHLPANPPSLEPDAGGETASDPQQSDLSSFDRESRHDG